jgi:hypothetical protein
MSNDAQAGATSASALSTVHTIVFVTIFRSSARLRAHHRGDLARTAALLLHTHADGSRIQRQR